MDLQTALQTYGYYDGEIDGQYGQATQDAVKKLQTDLGVTADGRYGSETHNAFVKAVEDGTLTPAASGTTTSETTTSETTTSETTTSG
jgi:peptidoglycan hydrolase-like protein with peptidoglycan-binding domain